MSRVTYGSREFSVTVTWYSVTTPVNLPRLFPIGYFIEKKTDVRINFFLFLSFFFSSMRARRFARCTADVKVALLSPPFTLAARGNDIRKSRVEPFILNSITRLKNCWGCQGFAVLQGYLWRFFKDSLEIKFLNWIEWMCPSYRFPKKGSFSRKQKYEDGTLKTKWRHVAGNYQEIQFDFVIQPHIYGNKFTLTADYQRLELSVVTHCRIWSVAFAMM